MNIKISVIIPCYNAEKYIERTFRALDNQTYRNFEVIVINDGSTDNSLSIVEKLVNERKNCYVYSFINEGLSEARNRGIPLAKGEYIYFLDADDYFLPTMFEDMVKMIGQYNYPDAVRCGYRWTFGNIDESKVIDMSYSELNAIEVFEPDLIKTFTEPAIGFSDEDVYQYYKTRKWEWKDEGLPVWIHFYKKNMIYKYNLRFVKGLKMVEDRIFNITFMAYAKRVVYTPNVYYFYMSTEEGLLSTIYKDIRGLYKDKIAALEQREKVRQLYIQHKGIDLWHKYRGSNIMACLQLAVELSKLPFFEGLRMYKEFVNNKLIRDSLSGFSTKGAPFKMKIPLQLLQYHMSSIFFLLVWLANKVGMKAGV